MILSLNTSIRDHSFIALFISLWLVVFLVLIAPRDIAELPFNVRLQLMPFYGILSFVGYMMLIPIQNWAYRQSGKWTYYHEVGFLILFNILMFYSCYAYYRSDVMRGRFSFIQFTTEIYYPIFFIVLSVILGLRWLLFKKKFKENQSQVTLVGANKRDVLQIDWDNLVSVTSADNYVEVAFILDGHIQKKLLRATLKSIEDQDARFLRIHRSHLINPTFFVSWIDTSTIKMVHMNLPISKSYKEGLAQLIAHP
jgi:hypothetical protein